MWTGCVGGTVRAPLGAQHQVRSIWEQFIIERRCPARMTVTAVAILS